MYEYKVSITKVVDDNTVDVDIDLSLNDLSKGASDGYRHT